MSEQAKQYHIGDLTFERVFKAAGIQNFSDTQAVMDAIEAALLAMNAERDAALDEVKAFKAAATLIPTDWSTSLASCWPADESEPDANWIVGTIYEDENKYPVIEVDAYQYDAHGHSEKIAKAIVALWGAAKQVKP